MATQSDKLSRSHLPMPNTVRPTLITYDAKDPDTKFPPIEQLRPPKGAPNVLIILIDDAGFGSSSAFGGPCQTPNAEKLAAGGLKYNRFHTTALCSPTRAGAADRAQPPLRRHGRHHRDRHRRAGLLLGAAQHHVAAGADAEAQRLLHRAVRQVPRSAGVGDEPGRTVRRLAHGRRRLRVLLRLHRRRGEPVVPDALRGHHAGRAEEDARRGLPLHGGHDRQGDGLDRRSRRRWRPTSRSSSTSRPARRTRRTTCRRSGPTSTRASSTRAGTSCARRPSPGRRSWASSRRTASSPRATRRFRRGTTCRRRSSRCCAARWRSTRASWSTPTTMSAACSTRLKKLGILDDTLVYYIIGDNGASAEGASNGCLQRDEPLQRAAGARDAGVSDGADRQARRAGVLQPLRRGLGARHEHALPVDQAGRLPLGRHAQRHHRALAEGHQGQGRDPLAVPPRHRRRADDPRGGRAARADIGERRAAEADRGRQHALLVQRRQGRRAARDAVLRDVRQPRHLPQGLDRGDEARHALGARGQEDRAASTTTSGSSTTPTRTGARRTIWPSRCRRSCTNCSACG